MHMGRIAGKRISIKTCLVALSILAVAIFLAGCGGGDGDEAEADASVQKASQAMVPGGADSVAAQIQDSSQEATGAGGESVENPVNSGAVDGDAQQGATLQAATDPVRKKAQKAAASTYQPPQVVETTGAYSLQLGSFRRLENAEAEAVRLRALGYSPELEFASLGGQDYHRVVLRGLADRNEAENLGEKIRAELGTSYLIRNK